MDEKWLHDIADQLADYEAKAPEGLWERIDSSLKGGVAGPRRIPLTRRPSFHKVAYRIAAVALLTLLLGGGVLLYLSDSHPQPAQQLVADGAEMPSGAQQKTSMQTATAQLLASQTPASQTPASQTTASQSAASQSTARDARLASQHVAILHAVSASSAASAALDSDAVVPLPSTSGEQGSEDHLQPSHDSQQAEQAQQPSREAPARRAQRGYFVPAPQSKQRQPHPVSVSLLASNVFADNRQTNGPGGVAMSTGDKYLAQEPISTQIQSGYGALNKHLIGNDGARVFDQEKHHKQPVRVGLSLAYPLSSRLSIGLGLYYTYLSSDFKSGSEHNYQSAHQSLHYLGIPVSVNYAFYRSSRFSFYTTGGMMAEKCVSGQSELLTVSVNSKEVEKQSLTEHRLQYSAFGSVGVQMDLVKHVGLYVEPGLSYYLDNHSRVVNLYKDEPLQFNLSAGVRVSF